MDVVRQQYYRLNALLLTALGLWPYGSRNLRLALRFTCSILLLALVISQLLTFVTVKYTTTLFLKNVSILAISVDLVLKYFGFCLHSDSVRSKLREILEGISADWSALADENEFEIIKKHAEKGKSYTKLLATLVYVVAGCMIVCEFSAIFLDIVKPLNESRPLELPVMTEVFVADERKFYILVVPFNFEMLTTGTTFVATESIYIMFLQHACGLFEIVRMQTFNETPQLQDSGRIASKNLKYAIHMHARALNYSGSLQMKFRTMTAMQYICGVVSLSTNLFRFTKAILISPDLDELLPSASISAGILVYMFYTNYIVQAMVDEAAKVFDSTYQTKWYEAPLPTQKLLLFVLVKNTKPFVFSFFGDVGKSMQDFSRVVQMSWSYFMVLYTSL